MKSSIHKNISGWWIPEDKAPELGKDAVRAAILKVTHPMYLLNLDGRLAVGRGGKIIIGDKMPQISEGFPLYAYAPPLHPENLGDPNFKKTHNLRYAYIVGAMANGITSVEMVEEAGRSGMVGFFGAAGLSLEQIETAIVKLQQSLKNLPFGFNLIHSPNDPELEAGVVQLYLKRGVRLVSTSAYLDLTLPLVYYRVKGIHRDEDDNIICPNKVIAKVSRIEVARKYLSPPPKKLLGHLVDKK